MCKIIRNLCFCFMLCLGHFSLASDMYPPGQPANLWKWFGDTDYLTNFDAYFGAYFNLHFGADFHTNSLFLLPNNEGVCLYHQEMTDQWFVGSVATFCPYSAGSECKHCRVQCSYKADGHTVLLRGSFWVLWSLRYLSLPEKDRLDDRYRLRFPLRDGEKGLCVIPDQKTNSYMPGWVSTGENVCKSGEVESEKYRQFQLFQPSANLGVTLLVAGTMAASAATIFWVCTVSLEKLKTLRLPEYLHYILLVGSHAQWHSSKPEL